VPSYVDSAAWTAWINNAPLLENTDGPLMSPGGFKAFEHLWSIPAAIEFHEKIGKAQIAARTAELANQLKAGLALMPHVRLVTPRDPRLSAGIVSFDVHGLSTDAPWPRCAAAGSSPRPRPMRSARAPDPSPDEQPRRGGPGPGRGSRLGQRLRAKRR
jgi:selenocysteine lyase/cysteine desulfurase